jgi:hypothetical protein
MTKNDSGIYHYLFTIYLVIRLPNSLCSMGALIIYIFFLLQGVNLQK